MVQQYNYSDVMISYSRRDTAFVKRLEAEFRKEEIEVWIDWEDIMPTEDWWQAIQAGIDAANTIIFIISPDSVQSKVCRRELEYALSQNKRIIPILFRPVEDPEVRDMMHPELRKLNWIYFRENESFRRSFLKLRTVLSMDLNSVREHTRLLVRAQEWEQETRPNRLLLRGKDIHEAESWLLQSVNSEPAPVEIQIDYIKASVRNANSQRRTALSIAAAVIVVLGSALLFGLAQTTIARQAVVERSAALAQQETAYAEVAIANANATAAVEAMLTATHELAMLNENVNAQQSAIETKVAEVATLNVAAVAAGEEAASKSADAATKSAEAAVARAALQQAEANAINARINEQNALETQQAGQSTVVVILETATEVTNLQQINMTRIAQLQPTLDAINVQETAVPMTQVANEAIATQVRSTITANEAIATDIQSTMTSNELVATDVQSTIVANEAVAIDVQLTIAVNEAIATQVRSTTVANEAIATDVQSTIAANEVVATAIQATAEANDNFASIIEGTVTANDATASHIQATSEYVGTTVANIQATADAVGAAVVNLQATADALLVQQEEVEEQLTAFPLTEEAVRAIQQSKCSRTYSTQVVVSITNERESAIDIYWMNYNCVEVFYANLTKGQTFTVNTFATHPWIIRDHDSQALLQEYTAASNGVVTIR